MSGRKMLSIAVGRIGKGGLKLRIQSITLVDRQQKSNCNQ